MNQAMIKRLAEAGGVWHLLVRAHIPAQADDATAGEAKPDPDPRGDESQSRRLA
jgi:hypothetical protein